MKSTVRLNEVTPEDQLPEEGLGNCSACGSVPASMVDVNNNPLCPSCYLTHGKVPNTDANPEVSEDDDVSGVRRTLCD